MKKILVGICGIGNGHVNRQINVIRELVNGGNRVVVAVPKIKNSFFDLEFPDIEKININIPWIACNSRGIDYDICIEKYNEGKIDQFKAFLEFSKKVEMIFNGKPDFIISDYEPNVAQYAYAANIPLICMEQQSKFLYLKPINIKDHSINEEIYRLNYFFPKVDYRIISSFFPFETKKQNIFLLPPIINDFSLQSKISNKGIVYFSPYCNDKNVFINILKMIKNFENINFYIYTNLDFSEYENNSNFIFSKFNENFKKDLSDSSFIISSSGHQLISECIYNEIPMYLFSLDTYEQNYNCMMVEEYNLGKRINNYSEKEFEEFYQNKSSYISNIKNYKQEFWISSWKEQFNKIMESIIKLEHD